MSETLTNDELKAAKEKCQKLTAQMNEVLFGQEELIELIITALLCKGNVLLEGLPGLGKTELVKGLSCALGISFKRIQFTPDLLPGDITGNPILQEENGIRKFVFQEGPLFANLVLADEINRASPKTQSALLEAMQENQVTVMGDTKILPKPFFVMATQNPIELEGTYPLLEAQLDRFLFKLDVKAKGPSVLERIISNRELGVENKFNQVMGAEELQQLIEISKRIYLPEIVIQFIAKLVHATQPSSNESARGIKFGASPRAAIALAAAVRAKALIDGRTNAAIEDVKYLALPVLRHRIIIDYMARTEGHTAESVIGTLIDEISSQSKQPSSTLVDTQN
jgi:MoxR-like ATPase